MKKKKAELTTQQIVLLIILITSFAVILFLLFRLNLGETTSKEVCHNSVILKGNSALAQEAVSLNCHTKYLCITADGSCEQMTKPEIAKVKDKEELYKVLADEMADCWWMFGEGKVDYVQSDMTKKLYCSICSQIAFDDSLKKDEERYGIENAKINQKDFYEYLADKKISKNEISYLEYLYGFNDLEEFEKYLNEIEKEFNNFDVNNQFYIIIGISSKISTLSWAVSGAGLGLAVFALTFTPLAPSVPFIVGAGLITTGGATSTLVGITLKGLSGDEYLRPTIIEVNSDVFKSLKCEEILTFQ
ncbi:MAG: hypothetical protein KJ646_01960 [Nanoarchaeota archaeon]|nr:hypothetical protein [Nanoarchaeota archaeon]MBU4116849.1 hypothetical protein [Nanoarchaeota archaeon]